MTAWVDRYVDASAVGFGSGTSPADPWTLAEAITNKADHQRVNIKCGAYTRGSSSVTQSNYWWRGYKDTPGDLDSSFVGNKTAQTDIPEIEITSGHLRVAGVGFNLSGLVFTNASSSDPALEDDVEKSFRKNCRFISTGSSNTRNVVQIDSTHYGIGYVGCEFSGNTCSGTSKPIIPAGKERHFVGCVFKQTDSTGNWTGIQKTNSTVTGCLFQDLAVGIEFSSEASDINGNTFYNISGNAIRANLSSGNCQSTLIRNNYFHTIGGYCIGNNSGPLTSNKSLYIENNARFNSPNFIEFTDQYIVSDYTDSGDPFENSAAGDFRLKSSSNAYQQLQGGFWRADMARYANAGAAQSECSSGGGGGGGATIHPLYSN